jgi:hypothetical protein
MVRGDDRGDPMSRAVAFLLVAATACQSSASSTATSAPPASQTAAVTVATTAAPSAPGVKSALSAAPGTQVTVVGLYLGWKGPCMGSAPTRSAWMLADAEGQGAPCVYVDGPAVPGVSPNAALGKNIRVRVVGVMRDDGGKYIEAQKVERQ